MNNNNEGRNVVFAVIISMAILFGWQAMFDPMSTAPVKQRDEVQTQSDAKEKSTKTIEASTWANDIAQEDIAFATEFIKGNITNKGIIFNDLTLKQYTLDTTPDSPLMQLLNDDSRTMAIEYTIDQNTHINKRTMWQTISDKTDGTKRRITLLCKIPNGVQITRIISFDHDYIITIRDEILNNGNDNDMIIKQSLITTQTHQENLDDSSVCYTGPIGFIDGSLHEESYESIRDKKSKTFKGKLDWLGISDQYWFTGFIPDSNSNHLHNIELSYNDTQKVYKIMAQSQFNAPTKQTIIREHNLYVGPKIVALLDKYEHRFNIQHFDKVVDFGWLYAVTKPLFYLLQAMNNYLNSFALALVLLTLLVKLLMLPLALKSASSMAKMRDVAPKIKEIQERFKDDKQKLQQKTMELYKKEKINPAAGCLPMLIQFPIAFGLYKVLYVSIEMRHAPFWGWINDLSAADPLLIINGFGLIAWTPPSFLQIGLWPILMGVFMYLQQKIMPQATAMDPTQQKIMSFLPFMMLFLFASLPSGVVIYWTLSTVFGLVQQIITEKFMKKSKAND